MKEGIDMILLFQLCRTHQRSDVAQALSLSLTESTPIMATFSLAPESVSSLSCSLTMSSISARASTAPANNTPDFASEVVRTVDREFQRLKRLLEEAESRADYAEKRALNAEIRSQKMKVRVLTKLCNKLGQLELCLSQIEPGAEDHLASMKLRKEEVEADNANIRKLCDSNSEALGRLTTEHNELKASTTAEIASLKEALAADKEKRRSQRTKYKEVRFSSNDNEGRPHLTSRIIVESKQWNMKRKWQTRRKNWKMSGVGLGNWSDSWKIRMYVFSSVI